MLGISGPGIMAPETTTIRLLRWSPTKVFLMPFCAHAANAGSRLKRRYAVSSHSGCAFTRSYPPVSLPIAMQMQLRRTPVGSILFLFYWKPQTWPTAGQGLSNAHCRSGLVHSPCACQRCIPHDLFPHSPAIFLTYSHPQSQALSHLDDDWSSACLLGERPRAGHCFGPLLTRSCNLGFLCGPFPVEDMGNAPFHKFLFNPGFFFSFLCILDVAYLNCHPFLPVFNHTYPFSLHYGEPEKAGAM